MIELIKASLTQKPILRNLLELYAYDFTEFYDFDIGDNGFYGYEYLDLYWTEPTHYPFLIYVNKKIAGFVFVQKGSPISERSDMWDIAEFFIMKRYKKQGIGTEIALHVWKQFKGEWQVRVLLCNSIACKFWLQAIKKFTGYSPKRTTKIIKDEKWVVYSFLSIE